MFSVKTLTRTGKSPSEKSNATSPVNGSEWRLAIGDWRLAKRQQVANSEWRIVNGFDHPPKVGGYKFKAG
jgi:hypothetical protein